METIKYISKKIITLLMVAFFAWLFISFFEIVTTGMTMQPGTHPEYSSSNFFTVMMGMF